jgi:hypothetical protein
MATKKNKNKTVIYGYGEGEQQFLAKTESEDDLGTPLGKSILNTLNGGSNGIYRLAFETDPSQHNNFAGVYHAKLRLVPDSVLKRIAIQDSLVASIVRARQNHLSTFGRPRIDRFGFGYIIKPYTGVLEKLDEQGKISLGKQISDAVKLLNTCGHTENVKTDHQKTFSEYLSLSVRSGIVCGRIATEIVHAEDTISGQEKFHHFVATDSGTIYRATNDRTGQESLRKEAYHLICKLTGKKLEKEQPWNNNEYAWVQVIDGTPKQVFTDKEMKVYNLYPVPDVELDGYPVTPIDTVITAVTTHVNITTHNKMYFQSGRATRGMLVITSDDISQQTLNQIKQNFNASINASDKAWRMPVFGVPTDTVFDWKALDVGGGRDMEFQYLTDMNAREILTAFMMSPDELPGMSYLSRGTASQALSESNKEYILEASRDVGIRPLLAQFEDFINMELFPLIDPDLAKKSRICLMGLDAKTEEKEAVELQTAGEVYMSFDDILQKVEKKPVGKEWGGEVPLNPVYKEYLDQYFSVGEILERFCNIKGASKDPTLAYRRDQYWFQWQQFMQQQQQLQLQQQQAAAEPPPNNGGGQPPQQGNQDDSGNQDDGSQGDTNQGNQDQGQSRINLEDDQTEKHRTDSQNLSKPKLEAVELGKAIDQAYDLMKKSETNLPPDKRKILAQHKKSVEFFIKGFEKDVKDSVNEILEIADQLSPRLK